MAPVYLNDPFFGNLWVVTTPLSQDSFKQLEQNLNEHSSNSTMHIVTDRMGGATSSPKVILDGSVGIEEARYKI